MSDIICPDCKDPINEHNAQNGCSHVRREQEKDVVCACWLSPQDIASARLEAIEAERDELREALEVIANYGNYATDGDLNSDYQGVHVSEFASAALLDKAGAG